MYRDPALIRLESLGIHLPECVGFIDQRVPQGNFHMAADAQPALVTTPNSGIPAFLSTFIDPRVIQVLLAPNNAALIYEEVKKGDWEMSTAEFPVAERTGNVSTYGDYSTSGSTGANVNFENYQSYMFQTITQWGNLMLARMSLAKIDYASQLQIASAVALAKFLNQSYFYGIAGLRNFGILNEPNLPTPIAPGPKAYNGNNSGPWQTNGMVTATASEIYTDIQSLFAQLAAQSDGNIKQDSKMTLALGPVSEVALTTTNIYNVNVSDLIKKNFPNLRVETAVQYQNTVGGNLVQLKADSVDGQPTGIVAYNERMRADAIIRDLSSFRQKKLSGTWGFILFQPFAVAQMLGI